ncbi:MAG: hypothetical protein Q8L92_09755 [Rubrivivax sp.]|nr:hypothetical protein [Rubrivivax sp.]
MKHPLAIALLAALLIIAGAFGLPLLGGGPAGDDGERLPWQVKVDDGGRSTVFGLQLPGATLATAQARWGDDMQIAVIARRGEAGALEAYLDNFRAGGITGRLLLATELPAAAVLGLRERARRSEAIDADTWRFAPAAADHAQVMAAALVGVSFIPGAQLDAATLVQRFGAPAERLRGSDRLEHWLYPALGLAIVLDTDGKELLQYVAPADFERRLVAPLRAAGAK